MSSTASLTHLGTGQLLELIYSKMSAPDAPSGLGETHKLEHHFEPLILEVKRRIENSMGLDRAYFLICYGDIFCYLFRHDRALKQYCAALSFLDRNTNESCLVKIATSVSHAGFIGVTPEYIAQLGLQAIRDGYPDEVAMGFASSLAANAEFNKALEIYDLLSGVARSLPDCFGFRDIVSYHKCLIATGRRVEAKGVAQFLNHTFENSASKEVVDYFLRKYRRSFVKSYASANYDDMPQQLLKLIDYCFGGRVSERLLKCISTMKFSENFIDINIENFFKKDFTAKRYQANLIFCCGHAWSGSSAVSDFLSDYKNVKVVPWHECGLIVSSYGFAGLADVFSGSRKISEWVVNFLTQFVFNEKNALLSLVTPSIYIESIIIFIHELSLCENIQAAQSVCDVFLSALIRSLSDFSEQNTYVFDNWVKIKSIEASSYVKSATYFCVIKDPRSKYITHVESDPSFHNDIKLYIKESRTSYRRMNSKIQSMVDCGVNIIKIKFKDFILYEEYRVSNVLLALPASAGGCDARINFDPEYSRKNVYNYTAPKYKLEVDLLTLELKDYLFE